MAAWHPDGARNCPSSRDATHATHGTPGHCRALCGGSTFSAYQLVPEGGEGVGD